MIGPIACYILYSACLDKFYTGITQESIENRLTMHNSGGYGKHFTSSTQDWQLFLVLPCNTVSQAMKIEKHIKKMKSKKYIQNLKAFPEMAEKLIEKFM